MAKNVKVGGVCKKREWRTNHPYVLKCTLISNADLHLAAALRREMEMEKKGEKSGALANVAFYCCHLTGMDIAFRRHSLQWFE
jgi:hypothetical protein